MLLRHLSSSISARIPSTRQFFSPSSKTDLPLQVGGLPQAELNQLELQFLLLNDFRLTIPPDEMQRYADQLIRFAQSRNGLANGQLWLSPTMTESRTLAPSRPMQSMGAFDAFGGAISGTEVTSDGEAPRNSTPRRSMASIANGIPIPIVDEHDERDQESSVYSETDTEAETSTDDEPTIRPSHSCASSDTQSLFSNDASASEDGHSSYDIHGDGDEDEEGPPTDDESSAAVAAGGFARRPAHYRWNSSASSVDEHAN